MTAKPSAEDARRLAAMLEWNDNDALTRVGMLDWDEGDALTRVIPQAVSLEPEPEPKAQWAPRARLPTLPPPPLPPVGQSPLPARVGKSLPPPPALPPVGQSPLPARVVQPSLPPPPLPRAVPPSSFPTATRVVPPSSFPPASARVVQPSPPPVTRVMQPSSPPPPPRVVQPSSPPPPPRVVQPPLPSQVLESSSPPPPPPLPTVALPTVPEPPASPPGKPRSPVRTASYVLLVVMAVGSGAKLLSGPSPAVAGGAAAMPSATASPSAVKGEATKRTRSAIEVRNVNAPSVKDAVLAFSRGDHKEALAQYRALAQRQPDQLAYQSMVHVLERRLAPK